MHFLKKDIAGPELLAFCADRIFAAGIAREVARGSFAWSSFAFGSGEGPLRMRWEASPLSSWGRVSVQWLHFFLKRLIDCVTPSGPGVVFVGKLFVRNSVSCLDLGPFRIPLSSRVTFETSCLWRYLFPRSRSPSQI